MHIPSDRAEPLNYVVAEAVALDLGLVSLWPVNRLFAAMGGKSARIDALFRLAGVEPGENDGGDGMIGMGQFVRLMQRSARLANDEMWGLRPQRTPLGTLSLACRLAVSEPTVERGLRRAFRFYHGVIGDFTIRLSVDGERVHIILHDELADRPGRNIMHAVIIKVVHAAIRWLTGKAIVPDAVTIPFPRPPHLEKLEAMLGVAIEAGAPHTMLTFRRIYLKGPVVAVVDQVPAFITSLPLIIAQSYQERRSLAQRTAGHIRLHGNWNATRDDVAAALGMTASTFRRRLYDEIGTSFQELKDGLRQAAALELVARGDTDLDDIARMLGFAELSPFHRAFVRWTGQSPGAYRQAVRDGRHAMPDETSSRI